MLAEQIKLKLDLFGTEITFFLRMISMEEESQYVDRLVKVSADKNREKDYEFLVDQLASWSYQAPSISPDPELEAKDTIEYIKEYFKDMTISKERIVNQAVSAYRRAIVPDVDFL